MDRRLLFIWISIALVIGVFVGCDVETEPQAPLTYAPASHIVINEVFTFPVSNANAHSWLEIYNPTSKSYNLQSWSLEFRTQRFQSISFLFRDSSLEVITNTTIILPDSVGRYNMPLVSLGSLPVGPNEFLTLVSSLERLRVYNSIGPGNGPTPESTPTILGRSDTAKVRRDSTGLRLNIPDTVRTFIYSFFLAQTDQIVLRNSSGTAVDVVRYGNFVYNGPGNDPYPGNQSIGIVPDLESIARYAGAYDTGNSLTDFYITGSGLRPLPHWLSQLYKR